MQPADYFGGAYHAMTSDIRGKLGGYHESLQMRFGDPRVYAMQEAEIARQAAAATHMHATNRADVLSSLYNRNRDTIRNEHNAKMAHRQVSRA
jgi:hypothetical protein